MANTTEVTVYKIDDQIYPCGFPETIVCTDAVVLETGYQLDLTDPYNAETECEAVPNIVNTEYIEYHGRKYWIAYNGTTSINAICTGDFPNKVEFDVLLADDGATTMSFPTLKGYKVHMNAGYVALKDSDEPGNPPDPDQDVYSWNPVTAIMTRPQGFATDEHIIIVPYKKA